jgi:hypothetical protein
MINKINNYPTIQNNWTHIIAKVQVGHNSNHLFTCIQFLIQQVVARTIHCAQSLLLMDNLTFDPHGVF